MALLNECLEWSSAFFNKKLHESPKKNFIVCSNSTPKSLRRKIWLWIIFTTTTKWYILLKKTTTWGYAPPLKKREGGGVALYATDLLCNFTSKLVANGDKVCNWACQEDVIVLDKGWRSCWSLKDSRRHALLNIRENISLIIINCLQSINSCKNKQNIYINCNDYIIIKN